jgi:hypothetical protein
MITYRDLLIESERRLDEMARARKARLIKQITANKTDSTRGYQRWLNRLGAHLIGWGSSLQAKYPARPIEAGAWRPNCT